MSRILRSWIVPVAVIGFLAWRGWTTLGGWGVLAAMAVVLVLVVWQSRKQFSFERSSSVTTEPSGESIETKQYLLTLPAFGRSPKTSVERTAPGATDTKDLAKQIGLDG